MVPCGERTGERQELKLGNWLGSCSLIREAILEAGNAVEQSPSALLVLVPFWIFILVKAVS